jgi:hypothetical protein
LTIYASTTDASGLRLERLTSASIASISTTTNAFLTVDANGDVILATSTADLFGGWMYGGNTLTSIMRLGTKTNHDLPFITNNTEKMRLSTNGRLSIGTSSADYSLEIYGTGGSASPNGLRIQGTGSVNGAIAELVGQTGNGNVSGTYGGTIALAKFHNGSTFMNTGSQIGRIIFGANHSTSTRDNILYSAAITGITESDFTSSTTMATAIAFYTGSQGANTYTSGGLNAVGTEKMRISNNGNVGIGISTPLSTLHLATTTGDATSQDLALTLQKKTASNNNSGIGIEFIGGTTNKRIAQIMAVNSGNAGGDIEFRTSSNTNGATSSDILSSSSTRMIIKGDGNVGIGVTPSAWNGAVRVVQMQGGSTYTNGVNFGLAQNLYFDTNWKYYASGAASRYDQTNGVHSWFTAFSGATGTAATLNQAMTLDVSGYLGLGTVSPSMPLDVRATSSGIGAVVAGFGSSATPRILFYDETVSGSIGPRIESAAGNAFRIVAGGSGGVQLASGATSWAAVSDERKKDILNDITDATSKIMSLRTVMFKYKEDSKQLVHPGFIAQDILAVLPEAVDVASDTEKTLAVRYTEIIPLLAAGIKEMNIKMDNMISSSSPLYATLISKNGTWKINEDGLIEADRIYVKKEICIDDICIDRNALLNIPGSYSRIPVISTTTPIDSPVSTTTPVISTTTPSGADTQSTSTEPVISNTEQPIESLAPSDIIPTDPTPDQSTEEPAPATP